MAVMSQDVRGTTEREGRSLVLRYLAIVVLTAGVLYALAGRLDWTGGALFCLVYFSFLAFMLTWSSRCAPDLLQERSRRAENVKSWDRMLLAVYAVLLLSLLVVGALDGGRFRWSHVPLPLVCGGAAGFAAVLMWIWWVASVNRYLSRWARIQDDRDHQVVTSGPYRFVRHPMYAAFLPGGVFACFTLESWYALVPAGMIFLLFIVRTALEDRMLLNELPGYREYAAHVRYRLLPGLW